MKTSIYIVINARDQWWVDLDGRAEGPFGNIDTAIRQAIDSATEVSRQGGRSEVRVMGQGRDNALVYQSSEKSLLGRAVAMAHQ